MTDATSKPTLLFFTSKRNGLSRRVEGFLAQVLQRRHNHDTFDIRYVASEERPDLHERFKIEATPTLVVLDSDEVRGKLVAPRGCEQIREFLQPWLR